MLLLPVLCVFLSLCSVTGFPSFRERRQVTYSKCENTYTQCSEWKKNGLCELSNYKDYMTMQCPVACGLCQQGETVNARSEIVIPDTEGTESGSGSAEERQDVESQGEEEITNQKEASQDNKNLKIKNKGQKADYPINQNPHKAPEENERAEKYEDSEDEENDVGKDQKDYKKTKQMHEKKSSRQNLLGKMLNNGELKAYSVHKSKPQPSNVRGEVEEADNDPSSNEGSIDVMGAVQELASAQSGLSGSGVGENNFQVILRQTFDSKYSDQSTPAFQILAGNFENDVEEALGDDSEVSDISFSEAEIEGNPRIVGKVKVTFKFKGDYKKLKQLVDAGDINGMMVVKNSLEGSIFDQ